MITRNAVHKQIKSLRALGYSIESKQSFGYKLLDDLNFIDYPAVEKKFNGRRFGHTIFHFKSLDSTNNEAYRIAESGSPEGAVIISEVQIKGKGRMGRHWESSMTGNLYFSIILRPKISPAEISSPYWTR